MGIHNCRECRYLHSDESRYSFYCDLQENGVRYKEYGTQNYCYDEAMAELYQMCPLIDIDEILHTPPKVLWEKIYNGD